MDWREMNWRKNVFRYRSLSRFLLLFSVMDYQGFIRLSNKANKRSQVIHKPIGPAQVS